MTDFVKISRRVAQERGLKRFYTGEPCARGHNVERFTSNGGCVDCMTFKTPNKRRAPNANNVGWPWRAIIFSRVRFTPTPEEIEACFIYAESQGWLDRALQDVHENPDLVKLHGRPPSIEERARAQALLDRAERVREHYAAQARPKPSTTPVVSFVTGITYYRDADDIVWLDDMCTRMAPADALKGGIR
jgi:hypothetical protein